MISEEVKKKLREMSGQIRASESEWDQFKLVLLVDTLLGTSI